jgi:poly(A) polymerase
MRIALEPDWREIVSRVNDFFSNQRVEAWATGGFIRDCLLGIPSRDLDVTIDADPRNGGKELAAVLGARFVLLDEQRGHVRLLLRSGSGVVDLMPLRAPTIEADLRLRDYTINALAAPLASLASDFVMIDPTGGVFDLDARLVRCTGEEALVDDPLRLLRGVRIANELGFALESRTKGIIAAHAGLIDQPAAERTRDELTRVFNSAEAAPGIRLLDDLGLFPRLFQEMEPARGFEQPKEHAYDVLGHSFAAVHFLDVLVSEHAVGEEMEQALWREFWTGLTWQGARSYLEHRVAPGMTRRGLIKLCGLLHDIGKPGTRTFDAEGRMRFFGHSDAGARLAGGLMRRLRFSRRETGIVRAMIEAHLRPVQLTQSPGGYPGRRAVYKFFRDTGDAGIDTLFLSLADHLATAAHRISLAGFRRHVSLVDHMISVRFSQEEVVKPPRLVTGDDLCATLGIEPSPLVGSLLEAIREARAAGEVQTREDALELARRLLPELSE